MLWRKPLVPVAERQRLGLLDHRPGTIREFLQVHSCLLFGTTFPPPCPGPPEIAFSCSHAGSLTGLSRSTRIRHAPVPMWGRIRGGTSSEYPSDMPVAAM